MVWQRKYLEQVSFLNLKIDAQNYLIAFQKRLIDSSIAPDSLGDTRKGISANSKSVNIRTMGEMSEFLKNNNIKVIVSADVNNAILKYKLLSAQYQQVYEIIFNSKDNLYTRTTKASYFHGNNKLLTNTQLMHINYLKRLFLSEVKSLLKESSNKKDLSAIIDADIQQDSHLINFNRTRYQWLKRDSTASQRELKKIIKEFKASSTDPGGEPNSTPTPTPTNR